ncbi:BCS1 N terminal-domain-containing protein, partial [Schizophyllum commune]
KLVVIGGTVETARRASVSAWNGFVDSFFLTAHFSQEDYPYDWLMHWLAKQPAWGRSREFDITTRSGGRSSLTQATTGDLEDEDEDDELVHGRRKRKVAFMPSLDTTHTIYYRGHWLRITRTKRYADYGGEALKISVVARNNDILKKLVLEAKREYEKDAEHRVHIFMADTSYGCWRWNGARQKRPMSSIVLQPGVKDMLLADCRDFLASEEWYAERGIPFRRGYLLHGVPGRCILLLEDLDAAFTRGISRDANSTGVPTTATVATASTSKDANNNNDTNDGSTLSLSGLLNSLDGVAAAEGRLLFATTNHIERLDPALSRPGRMDVWVNFTNATKWQAEGIFKCFFPAARPAASPTASTADLNEKDTSQKNLPGSKRRAQMAPMLSEDEISDLAKRFADAIPEDELSVAALQGYLLKNKTRPRECVDEVAAWVISERETREKIKAEKAKAEVRGDGCALQGRVLIGSQREAREAKDKKEKEEREEREKKEQAEKDKVEKEKAEKDKAERREARRKSKKVAPADAPKAEAAVATTEKPTPAEPSSSESSSPSSSDSENTTGIDADTEESATSEEETDKKKQAPQEPKEKWVAVSVKEKADDAAQTAAPVEEPAVETPAPPPVAATAP